jgi:protein tyrosine phosphatase (PTP) superfamily phosphohydrolase (DUF442 family)
LSAQDIDGILNYLRVSDTIGTAGQPDPGQFAGIQAAGYEAVINLAMPDSTNALANERELVIAQGMAYIHIPVVWENPTAQDLDRFFGAMDGLTGRKVFVHCAFNWRVSCFVLLYRVLRQGVPLEKATKALDLVWKPDAVWERFVHDSLARHGVSVEAQGEEL